jgi:hypothetical protein
MHRAFEEIADVRVFGDRRQFISYVLPQLKRLCAELRMQLLSTGNEHKHVMQIQTPQQVAVSSPVPGR